MGNTLGRWSLVISKMWIFIKYIGYKKHVNGYFYGGEQGGQERGRGEEAVAAQRS